MNQPNEFKHGRHYVYSAHYHLIWVTKYRNQIFTTSALQNEMKAILQSEANAHDIEIENYEVMPDHVHLLVSIPPRLSISNVIRILKGRSAYLFLQQHPEIRQQQCWGNKLWSSSYFMNTVGNISKTTVLNYINNQKNSRGNQ